MFDPDSAKATSSAAEGRVERDRISPVEDLPGKQDLQDLVELAAKFTMHGGGPLSPEVSADLALEIVLNEIAEQACLATPASGAAIVLKHDGEWVCRASAGSNAPSLGARLDAEAGLSGLCIKTRQVQRCDDAQSDPRADVEACQGLGVRSVIILPLLIDEDAVSGVFGVFSSHPSAFGVRDECTLQVLSQRVLMILKHTSVPLATFVEPAAVANPIVENSILDNFILERASAESEVEYGSLDAGSAQATIEVGARHGINLLTSILGAAVLALALFQTVKLGHHLFGGRAAARTHPPAIVPAPLRNAERETTAASGARGTRATPASGTQSAAASPAKLATSGSPSTALPRSAPRSTYSSPPAGSLLIYENGKEIFRMPPASERAEQTNVDGTNQTRSTKADGTVERPASGSERAGTYELSPATAEGSLLHRVEPDYPEEARQQKIQGPVVLDVRIGRDGTVQQATILSGQRLLAEAAISAVKQWEFRPRMVKGQAVEMQTRVTLNFRLPR